MIFYCKNCSNDFEIDDSECKDYYNWKCPECLHIAMKKDMSLGFGIIWNCDTGTAKKKAYLEPKKCEKSDKKNNQCSCCPNA